MAYWIKLSNTRKGSKFACSDCSGECICIRYIDNKDEKKESVCDYRFCPRCGASMDEMIGRK